MKRMERHGSHEERVKCKNIIRNLLSIETNARRFFHSVPWFLFSTIIRQELIDVARFMARSENHSPSTTHGAHKHSSSTNPSDQDGSTFVIGRESMVPTDGVDPSDDVRVVDSVSRRAKREK